MRILTASTALFVSTASAFAHPGHLAASSGHDHYVVLGAVALAVAVAVGGLITRARAAKN